MEKQSRLDNYIIIKKLDQGCSSTVYLIKNGQTYAAKVVRQVDKKVCMLLEKEYEMLKILEHTNIIKVIKHCNGVLLEVTNHFWEQEKTTNVSYIVMEPCFKASLFEIVMYHGNLNQNLSLFIFRQILKALNHCYEHDIFHRDIKPENILFDYNYQVKLIDFNAGGFGINNFQSEIRGTLMYMAPEMHNRIGYTGQQVDVFSLGVLLFIMLIGKRPFKIASQLDEYYSLICQYQFSQF